MSDTVNPYQSPETPAVPEKPLATQGALTETMLLYLKGASPWLRFVGILGFIGSGITVVWGFVFIAIIPFMNEIWDEVPGFESFSVFFGAAFSGGMAALIIGMGALMFVPCLFIYRFGEKIRSYLRIGAERELELAFKNNKSLWKFTGILCIVELAFLPLMIIVAVIVALV